MIASGTGCQSLQIALTDFAASMEIEIQQWMKRDALKIMTPGEETGKNTPPKLLATFNAGEYFYKVGLLVT